MAFILRLATIFGLVFMSLNFQLSTARNVTEITEFFPYRDPPIIKFASKNPSSEFNQGEIEKRSYSYGILGKLESHHAKDFCKGYCPENCRDKPPRKYTKTKYTTKTKIKYKTICPKGDCKKTTVTRTTKAKAQTLTKWSAISVFTTITETKVLPTLTRTVTSTIQTDTTFTSRFTSTFTVPFPVISPLARRSIPLLARGAPRKPTWLKEYSRSDICQACKKYAPAKSKTITVTKVKTIIVNKTKDKYINPKITVTVTKTITPKPITVYKRISRTITKRTTTTRQPLDTTTLLTTSTQTITTSTTVTSSVCAQQTQGISGIQVSPRGQLFIDDTLKTLGACCSFCFNKPGCNTWVFLQTSCAYAITPEPPVGPRSDQCPNGLGYAIVFPDPTQLRGFAGKGACDDGT